MYTHTQFPETSYRQFANSTALFDRTELRGPSITFARNEEVFGEGEPAEFVYKLMTGCVRTYKLLSDGRRQITGFYLPGDLFGLEAGEDHSTSAEAIVTSTVLLVKRAAVFRAAEQNMQITRDLWAVTAAELKRSQKLALLLIKSAQERLAMFILEMAERLNRKGEVELPMSRQDIADYLGLTIETVSRTLTQFADAATIELVASRQIVLRNRSALSELNS